MGSGAGAFAEYVAVDQGRVQQIPHASMTFEEAATLPVALQTMHDAVVTHGELKAGPIGPDPRRQFGRRADGPADRAERKAPRW